MPSLKDIFLTGCDGEFYVSTGRGLGMCRRDEHLNQETERSLFSCHTIQTNNVGKPSRSITSLQNAAYKYWVEIELLGYTGVKTGRKYKDSVCCMRQNKISTNKWMLQNREITCFPE